MAPTSGKSNTFRKTRSIMNLAGRMSLTRGMLRRYVWAIPLLALLALLFAGTWLRARMEHAMQAQLRETLQVLLDADVKALTIWLHAQEQNAQAAAQEDDVRKAVLGLVKLNAGGKATTAQLLEAPERKDLAIAIKPWMESMGYVGYIVVDRDGKFLASKAESLIGQQAAAQQADFVEEVLQGKPTVSPPLPSVSTLEDEWGRLTTGVPTMFAAAPLRDESGAIVAVVGLRIRPDEEFSDILNVAHAGQSGEIYVFDRNGLMLSQSRFEDQLKEVGILPDSPYARSVLAVEVRDPGVDLTQGERPKQRRSEMPLTEMAQDAIQGHTGMNVTGYRDYRGVPSIGAWTWLPHYDFGIACEVDVAEAFAPVYVLRTAFWILFGLLSAGAVSLLGMTLLAGRLEARMRQAVIAAGQLGQYALEEKIGEGGMGMVYRGHHAMLRRPTAIKMLEPSRTTDVAIARFEREVQITSQLNHPNTITVYDYGRTREGVFYYAMEYLEGYSLQRLVERFGPLPDGRVMYILQQVCGSLQEAHAMGLIHRDIKPANIMLTERGGVADFVKLLDFGLVKAVDSRAQRSLTIAESITGTPLYMSPESIQDAERADTRSDLYSLGAVAYFLLTGTPVFDSETLLDVIKQHLDAVPQSPSQRLGEPVSHDLESVVLRCLAKSPKDRPQTAAEVGVMLAGCTPLQKWTLADADAWWKKNFHAVPLDHTIDLNRTAAHISTMGEANKKST